MKKFKERSMNRELLKSFKRLMKTTLKENGHYLPDLIITSLFGGFIPVLIALISKYITAIVSTGGSENLRKLIISVGLYAVLSCMSSFLLGYIPSRNRFACTRVRFLFTAEQIAKTFKVDFERIESGSFVKKHAEGINATSGDQLGIEGIMHFILETGAPFFSLILLTILIGTWQPLLIVAIFMYGYCFFYAELRKNSLLEAKREELSSMNLYKKALHADISDISCAKEIKIYGLKDRMLNLHESVINKARACEMRSERSAFKYHILPAILMISTQIFFAFKLLTDYFGGRIEGDSLLFYLTLMLQLILILDRVLSNIAFYLYGQLDSVNKFYKMLDDEESVEYGSLSPDLSKAPEIEFKDLTFTYEDAEKPVFENFNLKIAPGETLALVGDNGAGKSTLVKLLCGLYLPDSGEIYINGHALREYKREELPNFFNAVFQDVGLFPYTIKENVAMGPAEDEEKVKNALREVGVAEKVESFEKGINQPVGKACYADGAEFSGGEAQKISIARAVYKNAPVTFLDEPTAALDALAEAEIYENLHNLNQNKTSIYISHRLSSTKFCDRIILLREGRIIEEGSHKELLDLGGSYAELFKLQGKYYQKEAAARAKTEREKQKDAKSRKEKKLSEKLKGSANV